ncbi:acyl-[ACP]--phospholipid O-acyltransferase [Candidatus Omnitrophota bacterium]
MRRSLSQRGFKALLATQFLGAFNDNAFKLIVSLFAVNLFVQQRGGTEYLSLPAAIFILPFLLFSTYAGFVADRVSKHKIIIWTKVLELIVMVLGFAALSVGNIWAILVVLFLMGLQSTFFGPAKYGILPEMLDDEDLSEGNGAIQLWTYVAIISGMAFGGYIFYVTKNNLGRAALFFIAISILGIITSFFVTRVRSSGSRRRFEWNFPAEILKNIKRIALVKAIWLSIVGLVYFGLLASIFQLNILIYAQKIMRVNELYTGFLLTLLALGVGVGSIVAGKISAKKVEFGFVPLGSLGLSLFSILLGFTYSSYAITAICLFIFGVSAGFYIVPLNTYIQQQSPQDRRGQVLATLNFLSFLAVLMGTGIIFVLREWIELNAARIFFVSGICSILVTAYIFRVQPIAFIRLLNWFFTHSFYKMKVVGTENVPREGGALLVCNHVSFIDPLLIQGSLQRPIRFLIWRAVFKLRAFNSICRIMKVIPISFTDQAKTIAESLEEARRAIKQGELVCIFAEGHLTRTGNMLSFNRGFEHIMKGIEAPIIPMYIDRMWGSIFSFKDGRPFWKMPKTIPYPLTLCFGKPMASDSEVHQVRTSVLELSSEAFKLRGRDQEKLHIAFVNEAKKHPFKFCIADSTKMNLNYLQALASVMVISKKLFPSSSKYQIGEMIGILLPASCIASLTNGATLFAGKIPVNLNFTASKESIDSSIKQCQIKTIITSRKFLERLKWDIQDNMVFVEDLKTNISSFDKITSFLAALLLPRWAIRALYIRGDKHNINDVATVIFSSGSTGEPKGIMLSHGNIFSNIEGFYQVMHLEPDDIIVGVLPFFHSFGFTATLCLPPGCGIGAVYHNNPLDAATIGKIIQKFKATILLGTPTFFSAYIKKCSAEQFKSVRYALAGAEKLKQNIADAFSKKFGIIPFEGYGATELSPIVSLGISDQINEDERLTQPGYKPGKVGQPIPGVAAKIVDPDTFKLLPYNEEGLLLIKGPNVMLGYLNQPEKTKEVIKDGWYITGDIATMDEDGFIQITDRLSRFSKIGGEMVPHIKIEEEITNILGAVETLCAVTSVPDEKKGERLVVLYKGDIDIEKLWEQLNASQIPKLWIPKKDSFYKIENIPLLGSGKLDLKRVKRMAQNLAKDVSESGKRE